jgi:hypothetical protein
MPTSPIVQLLLVFAVSGLAFAFWKGGAAERLAAGVVAANLISGLVLGALLATYAAQLRFGVDGLTALALLAITLRFAAPWMGGVMLFYAAQFALHGYYLTMGRKPTDYLHAVINNLNFTGVLGCLVIGTALAWRRRVRAARAAAT